MKLIIVIVKLFMFDDVKMSFEDVGVLGMMVSEI